MEAKYKSILSKNALAYNLAYHIKEAKNEQELCEIIDSLLTSFEYQENKAKD
jgi:hypothetical protein